MKVFSSSRCFKLFIIILVVSALGLFACTTPDRNDYAAHVRSSDVYQLSVIDTDFKIMDEDVPLKFWVVSSDDNATEQRSMMYSADAGVGGFVAQIVAHAAYSKEAQNKKLAQEQKVANSVLANYQEFLNNFSKNELLNSNQRKERRAELRWKTESMPFVYFTRDLKTVRLRHLVVVRDSEIHGEDNIIYGNTIDVISSPSIDVKSILESEDKQAFSDLIEQLYSRSIELAFKDVSGDLTSLDNFVGNKTFIINESDKKRVERGQVVIKDCHQKVIRNLRGWVVAFSMNEEKTTDCIGHSEIVAEDV